MSPPDRPTLVNRNAKRARGVQIRKSAAMAITLPAPAAMPWMPAMIGTGHSRIARITSPVILVKPIRPAASILISSPMISYAVFCLKKKKLEPDRLVDSELEILRLVHQKLADRYVSCREARVA